MQILHSKDLNLFSHLKGWHLHEVTVVILSEIIFNKIKFTIMKDTILKISIHLIISRLLLNLECLITQVGGQVISLDR